MSSLLKAITDGWSWKLGTPELVVATNRFGNAIVRNAVGHYFRIVPEEWRCDLFASSAAELEEKRKTEAFIRDWEMTVLVEKAEGKLGALAEGEVYFLVIPGVLGGEYAVENIRKIPLEQLLAYSGSMAHQIESLPDGSEVKIMPE